MTARAFSRAVVVGVVVSMLSAGIAFADAIVAEGDMITPGTPSDPLIVQPGAVIPFDVGFTLTCSGTKHVNANQSVILTFSAIAPAGGAVSGTDSIISPPGDGWPADGTDCRTAPSPIVGEPSHVSITAPTDGGSYSYTLMWFRTLDPSGSGDTGTFTSGTSLTVTLIVDANVAPTVAVPTDMTVEGNTTGGANVTYTATATDPEDDPDPTPTCEPASGAFFALGTTTVTCMATDSGGKQASASFSVTVVDTTAPSLDVPSDISVQTTDPSGSVVAYAAATASDVVDDSVPADCTPASGSLFPVGDTTVNCAATDDAGNTAHASFDVRVSQLAPTHTWSAVWDEPVGEGGRLSTPGGRTIPVKVQVFRDGAVVKSGSPMLSVRSCGGGGVVASTPLDWGSGNNRWSGHLDSSGLGQGCYQVIVMVGDAAAGSFTLHVTASSSASLAKKGTKPRR